MPHTAAAEKKSSVESQTSYYGSAAPTERSSYMALMNQAKLIAVEPDGCGERFCVRGLRIRVKDVLALLATGASRDEILKILRFSKPSKARWYAPSRRWERRDARSCGCPQGGWLIAIQRGGKPVKLV
jgi:hypothetical protein